MIIEWRYRALAKANASIEESRAKTVLLANVEQQKEREEFEEATPDGPCMAKCTVWQSSVHGLVTSDAFDQFIMAAIGLNTVCLAIVHYDQPDVMTDVLDYLEYLFTTIFVIEAIIKIYGLQCGIYFTDSSNVFDFVITSVSLVSLFDIGAGNFSALRTLRVFRALRIARILRRFPVVMR